MSLKRSDKNTNGNGAASADAAGDSPEAPRQRGDQRQDRRLHPGKSEGMELHPRPSARAAGTDARVAKRQQARAPRTRPHERDETTRCQSRAEGGVSQAREESPCRTAGESDGVHRRADAAHRRAASAEPRRASLSNALPNAKTPGYFVRTVPHARRLRGLLRAMMPLLRSRMNARSDASRSHSALMKSLQPFSASFRRTSRRNSEAPLSKRRPH